MRLRASEVLEKLGVPKGRVLVRMNESDRPYVMWECDYASAEQRKEATLIEKKSVEFQQLGRKRPRLFPDCISPARQSRVDGDLNYPLPLRNPMLLSPSQAREISFFKKILDKMGTLVSDFKRYTWQVVE